MNITLGRVIVLQNITVITADVIGSREANMSLEHLSQPLRGLSHPALVVPFTISRGDELQGVMLGWMVGPEILRWLRWWCQPLKLRVGVGLGTYQGELGDDPWKLNGPAFFRARKALDALEGKEPATYIVSGSESLDTVLNAGWTMIDTVLSGWTAGQWEAVMAYEEGGTYSAAAKKLGVAAQNVQKRCKAARWNPIRKAEKGLGTLEKLAVFHPNSGDAINITQNSVRGTKL